METIYNLLLPFIPFAKWFGWDQNSNPPRHGVVAIPLPEKLGAKGLVPDFDAAETIAGEVKSLGLSGAVLTPASGVFRWNPNIRHGFLEILARIFEGKHLVGVYEEHHLGEKLRIPDYLREAEFCLRLGDLPMIAMSHGTRSALNSGGADYVELCRAFGEKCGPFIIEIAGPLAAEYGVLPEGRILEQVLSNPRCLGVSDSSFEPPYSEMLLTLLREHKKPIALAGNEKGFVGAIQNGWGFHLGTAALAPCHFAHLLELLYAEDWAYEGVGEALEALGTEVYRAPMRMSPVSLQAALWVQGRVTTPQTVAGIRPEALQEEVLRLLRRLRDLGLDITQIQVA